MLPCAYLDAVRARPAWKGNAHAARPLNRSRHGSWGGMMQRLSSIRPGGVNVSATIEKPSPWGQGLILPFGSRGVDLDHGLEHRREV